VLANLRMAEVLKAKGYTYQFVYAREAGHVDRPGPRDDFGSGARMALAGLQTSGKISAEGAMAALTWNWWWLRPGKRPQLPPCPSIGHRVQGANQRSGEFFPRGKGSRVRETGASVVPSGRNSKEEMKSACYTSCQKTTLSSICA
jgi:hypothetical protein